MRYLSVFLAAAFLLIAGKIAAQQPTMDEMLDDGHAGYDKFVLKTNPFTMLNGDFPVYAEVKLLPRISLEAGAGIQMGYFLKEWLYYISGGAPVQWESDEQPVLTGGYSMRVLPRFYLSGRHLEGLYIGPFWRKRQYGVKDYDAKVNLTDWCLMLGQQHNLYKNLYFDYYLGLGYRSVEIRNAASLPTLTDKPHMNIVMPWGIKVGYGF